MMDSLRAWLLALAGAALLTALAAMFPTSESLRRIVKLIGGVALTCLLFSPLVPPRCMTAASRFQQTVRCPTAVSACSVRS